MLKPAAESASWRWLGGVAIVLAAIAAPGCGTLALGQSDEDVVKRKAQQRWDAVIGTNLKSAYDFMSPASRSVMSYEAFDKSIKRGFHKAARVTEVRCPSRELCDVSLEIEYEFSGRRMKTPLYEKWVKQDSDWWYLYQK